MLDPVWLALLSSIFRRNRLHSKLRFLDNNIIMNIIISLILQKVMSPDSMTSLIEVNSLLLRPRPTTKRETRERKVGEDDQKKKSVRMRRRDLKVPPSLLFYLPISFTLYPPLCARRLPQRRLSLPPKVKQNKPPEKPP